MTDPARQQLNARTIRVSYEAALRTAPTEMKAAITDRARTIVEQARRATTDATARDDLDAFEHRLNRLSIVSDDFEESG